MESASIEDFFKCDFFFTLNCKSGMTRDTATWKIIVWMGMGSIINWSKNDCSKHDWSKHDWSKHDCLKYDWLKPDKSKYDWLKFDWSKSDSLK